ncbi:MAG: MarC family protein [Bacteroidales bacterium]|jgi:multiple antibiotic resistance protein|nr:MarC family protein [Bacteroidales bacterium]MBQ5882107.1 MarC family protein [Bacteroidales bacterium]
MGLSFCYKEILSAFMVLFAVIDITGSIPVIISLKEKGQKIESGKAAIISTIIFVIFLFLGEAILSLFGVSINAFAVAGSLVFFILAGEMILDVEIFKYQGPGGTATIVPIVFPLIAGTGSLTTVLTLRAEYAIENIILAILINMLIVFVVLRNLSIVEKILGKGGVYILRKFFGIILLAIAVKLFTANITSLF